MEIADNNNSSPWISSSSNPNRNAQPIAAAVAASSNEYTANMTTPLHRVQWCDSPAENTRSRHRKRILTSEMEDLGGDDLEPDPDFVEDAPLKGSAAVTVGRSVVSSSYSPYKTAEKTPVSTIWGTQKLLREKSRSSPVFNSPTLQTRTAAAGGSKNYRERSSEFSPLAAATAESSNSNDSFRTAPTMTSTTNLQSSSTTTKEGNNSNNNSNNNSDPLQRFLTQMESRLHREMSIEKQKRAAAAAAPHSGNNSPIKLTTTAGAAVTQFHYHSTSINNNINSSKGDTKEPPSPPTPHSSTPLRKTRSSLLFAMAGAGAETAGEENNLPPSLLNNRVGIMNKRRKTCGDYIMEEDTPKKPTPLSTLLNDDAAAASGDNISRKSGAATTPLSISRLEMRDSLMMDQNEKPYPAQLRRLRSQTLKTPNRRKNSNGSSGKESDGEGGGFGCLDSSMDDIIANIAAAGTPLPGQKDPSRISIVTASHSSSTNIVTKRQNDDDDDDDDDSMNDSFGALMASMPLTPIKTGAAPSAASLTATSTVANPMIRSDAAVEPTKTTGVESSALTGVMDSKNLLKPCNNNQTSNHAAANQTSKNENGCQITTVTDTPNDDNQMMTGLNHSESNDSLEDLIMANPQLLEAI